MKVRNLFRNLVASLLIIQLCFGSIGVFAGTGAMTISHAASQFYVGQEDAFTITTIANGDFGKAARAWFTIPSGAHVTYLGEDGNYHPLSGVYGPEGGFSISDETKGFKASFDSEGTYTINVVYKQLDGTILATHDIVANIVRDATVPVLDSFFFSESSPQQMQVGYTEPVYVDNGNGFTILLNDIQVAVTSVSGSGTDRLTLNLESPILMEQELKFAYDSTIGNVRDFAGNKAESRPLESRGIMIKEKVKPTFVDAYVDLTKPNEILAEFSEAIHADAGQGFIININGVRTSILELKGNRTPVLTFVLADSIASGDVVTIAYSNGYASDEAFNILDNFTAQPVTISAEPIDIIQPKITGVAVENGEPGKVTFTFDEPVEVKNTDGFTVLVNGWATTFNGYSGSGTNIIKLNMAIPARYGYPLAYSYSQQAGSIVDLSSNPLASVTGYRHVDNNLAAGGSGAPVITGTSISNSTRNKVNVVFNEIITAADISGFTIKVDGSSSAITAVSGVGTNKLVLKLSKSIIYGQAVSLSYNPGLGTVLNASHVELESVTNMPVTNNISAPNPSPKDDKDDSEKPSATPIPDTTVNGQKQDLGAAVTIKKEGDRTVATVVVDSGKIANAIDNAQANATISIPVATEGIEEVVGQLPGDILTSMQQKSISIEIQTDIASYTLPSNELKVDPNVKPEDVKVNIRISEAPVSAVQALQNTTQSNSMALVTQPVEFTVTLTYNNTSTEIDKFSVYVSRVLALPRDFNSNEVYTAVVLNADGSVSQVPTKIVQVNGKYYAIINSLTNSIYAVISNKKQFIDVEKHWSKEAVNALGSRLVIEASKTSDEIYPDEAISRAEFTSMIVKALGLRADTVNQVFKDVTKEIKYAGAISKAYEYGVVTGNGDRFRPEDKITRQEALTILHRAMQVAKVDMPAAYSTELKDQDKVAKWAKEAVSIAVAKKIVIGSNGEIKPLNNITRAEGATIIYRMLLDAGLINKY